MDQGIYMKFAHIADTHIRNLKYHKEYRQVFQHLYNKLEKEKIDYIIHCGDIAHTKTQISPEFVEMCADFFKNLARIAPTYIILGNHDGNLRNSTRQDALSPIVEALNCDALYLLKDSGEVKLDEGEERQNWVVHQFKHNKKVPMRAWGGLLTENASQALSRDIFSDMMLRLEEAGIKIIFHVHDEFIIEVEEKKAEQTLEQVLAIMSTAPDWIADIPLEAEGKIVNRYQK